MVRFDPPLVSVHRILARAHSRWIQLLIYLVLRWGEVAGAGRLHKGLADTILANGTFLALDLSDVPRDRKGERDEKVRGLPHGPETS